MKSVILLILTATFFITGCSSINVTNNSNNRIITFQKVKFELHSGEQIIASNVVMDPDSGIIKFNDKKNNYHYNLIEIRKLEYSNTNLGKPLAFLGGLSGFMIPLISSDGGYKGKTNNEGIVTPDLTIPISIISGFVGIITGQFIGSRVFIKWEKFPLEEKVKQDEQSEIDSTLFRFQSPMRN